MKAARQSTYTDAGPFSLPAGNGSRHSRLMKSFAAKVCPNDIITDAGTARGNDPRQLGSMDDHALLARLFSQELPEEEAQCLAADWLERHHSIRGIITASRTSTTGETTGEKLPTEEHWQKLICLCFEIFTRALQQGLQRGAPLTSPAETLEYLQCLLQARRREVFCCVFLDTRHRVICLEELFQGSIDGACVYPRVVAEHALRYNAAAVIVAHNHPSGVSEPSLADQAITRRLKDALSLLEIRLLDHFIIGDGQPVSLAARGMI